MKMVLWISGMSGVGKTVVGREVYNTLKKKHNNVIFIDGDIFREIMENDIGYTLEDRKKNARRISKICRFLDSQGIHVVCAILSNFPESQKWNRENIKDYYEVYLHASFETLLKRDSQGLYSRALAGKIFNVIGVDIKFTKPLNPDLVIQNEGDRSVVSLAQDITDKIIKTAIA